MLAILQKQKHMKIESNLGYIPLDQRFAQNHLVPGHQRGAVHLCVLVGHAVRSLQTLPTIEFLSCRRQRLERSRGVRSRSDQSHATCARLVAPTSTST